MSKVILTGATGSAGAEALRQLLAHPSIAHVTVLSRRDLPPHIKPSPPSGKLSVILHSDFLSYSPDLLKQLEGHDGVVWDLGKSSIGMKEDEYSVVHVDYPLAAAKAFATLVKPDSSKKFVFALLAGQGTSQDERKASQMFGKVKGRAEHSLALLQSSLPLAVYSFRPAIIVPIHPSPDDNIVKKSAYALIPFIRGVVDKALGAIDTDVLALGMVEAVLKGSSGVIPGWEGKGKAGDAGTFNNTEIIKLAKGSLLAPRP